jgi:hypothetical protein
MKARKATKQSASGTRARSARPGIDADTMPFASAIASIVIQTIRVLSGSRQIVESVMLENSLVYPAT